VTTPGEGEVIHALPLLGTATLVDRITFGIGATIIILGAIGVVISRNPVHSALMLVMTLFGVAVLFVEEGANFLAAVQVIVYAGAIVVLFLFVIMFLGVDREENLAEEPLPVPAAVGRRPDGARPGRAAHPGHRRPLVDGGPSVAGAARASPAATWPPSAGASSPPTCSPSRSPPPCS
jgi:energy-converting hydrogenase Eha subunit C